LKQVDIAIKQEASISSRRTLPDYFELQHLLAAAEA
jgi:hypothetical protein